MSVCILLVCVYSTVYVHYLGRYACLLACIYICPLLPLRDSPPGGRARAVRCTKLDPEASGNVGVDALRHAWRDCAKGSHFNHCSRACVGCSHEVKRVRRPLFFFWQMTGEMTTLQYCTVPPGYLPHLAPTYGRKNTLSHLPMLLSSSTGVLLHTCT